MHILHVVGARPNFMKVAPVLRALKTHTQIHQTLVHTGQHYDGNMSNVFFCQLGIPEPDINLGIGNGSHAVQTAHIMTHFEAAVSQCSPDRVLVYGDVNSTLAATLVCAKLGIPVDHVEAGLRSGDRSMPEEINRLLTDQICDLLFTPSHDGNANLQREGVDMTHVHLVGNVMIDTLVQLLPIAEPRWDCLRSTLAIAPQAFGLITLHRPSNVDNPEVLADVLTTLGEISTTLPLLFPVHPRTKRAIESISLDPERSNIHFLEPLGYIEFLALQKNALFVVTDSGGIQEETTYLGTPCLTLRSNTERPVTVTKGSNLLVGTDTDALRREIDKIVNGNRKTSAVPELWDGHASERIASVLAAVAS